MPMRDNIVRELRAVGITTLYFAVWLGVLILLKKLILAEYDIRFRGLSMALIGALVLAKVVLVLEHVNLGRWMRFAAAWLEVAARTLLYALGVVLVLVVERAFETRGEHGGFLAAVPEVFATVDRDQVWVNAIAITGALLFYNVLSVVRRHLGPGGLARLLMEPVPDEGEGGRET